MYNEIDNGGAINVTNCTLTGNKLIGTTATIQGGGICNINYIGAITISGCTLTSNSANGSNGIGGGTQNTTFNSGTVTVTKCTLSSNSAGFGAGINNYSSNINGAIILAKCTLTGNTASSVGGGIQNESSNSGPVSVTNCVFTGNKAPFGGGIYNYFDTSGGTISITNCTLTSNTGTSSGGGMDTTNSGTVIATNDILYGDNSEIKGTSITANYCDVQGGYAGTNNKNADPVFSSAPTNLHLLSGSPLPRRGNCDRRSDHDH